MKKMSIHTKFCCKLICIFILFSSCTTNHDSPERVLQKAQKAIADKNAEGLKKFLIKDNKRTPEMVDALAKLLIFYKTDNYVIFDKKHGKSLQEIDFMFPTKTNNIRYDIVFGLPPMSEFLKFGTFNAETNIYSFSYPKTDDKLSIEGTFELIFKRTSNGWKFWPKNVPANSNLINTNTIVDELPKISAISDIQKRKKALNQLMQSVSPKTEFTYKKQALTGKLEGVKWVLTDGMAYQDAFVGEKYKYMIYLSNNALIDTQKCWPSANGDTFQILVNTSGEYDLNYSKVPVSIAQVSEDGVFSATGSPFFTEGRISIQIDEDKNLIQGELAAALDDDNYLNGTFSVSVCMLDSASK